MSERKNPEEKGWSTAKITAKIIGTILLVLAIAILIIVDVLRTSAELGLAGVLLVFATSLVIIGTILSHLPQEKKK